ncbi:MAG TPA: TerC family protein [Kiloniellales bacterium]|nr:TerC family protein [Kiloniellales bacterium]
MEFLFIAVLGKPLWLWLAFLALVGGLLAFDLGVLHRRPHEISFRESLFLSAFYIFLGIAFGGFVWLQFGSTAAVTYWTGFVIEKSLSFDNIFVIAAIFGYFSIPRLYQHRVLVYGILGVIILRGLMIGVGATLIAQFYWILYIFAGFLIVTGIRMLTAKEHPYDVGANPLLRFCYRHCRVTPELHGQRFFVRRHNAETGRAVLFATPLFLALVSVEVADAIFAVDSIPAIFTITTDPYIVFTSNLFAILGLRALFFALSALLERFIYLKYALSLVLIFIGGKILVADLLGVAHMDPLWSLLITLSILSGGIAASLWRTAGKRPAPSAEPPHPVALHWLDDHKR